VCECGGGVGVGWEWGCGWVWVGGWVGACVCVYVCVSLQCSPLPVHWLKYMCLLFIVVKAKPFFLTSTMDKRAIINAKEPHMFVHSRKLIVWIVTDQSFENYCKV